MDAGVLGFTFVISLATAVIFGLAPAFHSTGGDLPDGLREGGRTSASGFRGGSLRNTLAASEIALALILLIGAGLTLRSLRQLQNVNPGFRSERILTMPVSLPGARYPEDHKRVLFFETLLDRIRSLPGVDTASSVTCFPLGGGCWDSIYLIEGRPIPRREDLPNADFNTAQPGYFRTMGIPILKGRDFEERDGLNSERVVIVNESFARQNWPNEDPLGKRVKQDWPEGTGPWMTVIGVVGDAKRRGLDVPFKAEAYKASRQTASGSMQLVIRTALSDPQTLAQAVRREIQRLDADLPVFNVRTMDFYAERALASRRFPMLLLGIFAAVALVLAAVGIYGVMSYSVTQRTHEMGIRLALGARAGDVRRLVVGHGFKLAFAGILVGLAGALALTRLLSTLLYGVEPTDPLTFISVSVLLTATAGLACYLPARRATKVDPIIALRCE
jgi:putative ABC transport system permease protein